MSKLYEYVFECVDAVFVAGLIALLLWATTGCSTQRQPARIGECDPPTVEEDGYRLFRCDLEHPGDVSSWSCAFVRAEQGAMCFVVMSTSGCNGWVATKRDCFSEQQVEEIHEQFDPGDVGEGAGEPEAEGRCIPEQGECA